MKDLLKEEIHRILEVMGLSPKNTILEQSALPKIFEKGRPYLEKILESFGFKGIENATQKNAEEILSNLQSVLSKSTIKPGAEIEEAISLALKKEGTSFKSGQEMLNYVLGKMETNIDDLEKSLSGAEQNASQALDKMFVEISQTTSGKNIEFVMNGLLERGKDKKSVISFLKSLPEYASVPDWYWKRLESAEKISVERTSAILSELENSARTKMKENFSVFRREFKKSFDRVVSKRGKSYGVILGPEAVKNTQEGLKLLETLFPGKKFRFADGRKDLTIEEIKTEINGYKGLQGPNGEWSSVNYLDTNSLDNTEFFISQAKKILSEEEFKTLMTGFSDGTITTDNEIFRKVLTGIENDTKLWDNMIENPSNYLTNIPKTIASGTKGEEGAKAWIRTMDDVKILWEASTGSPIDRLMGVDLILDVAGEASTANVKQMTGRIYEKINENTALGDSYRIWSKYGVYISKQSNLNYGIIADSEGSFIMMKKQPGVDWSSQTRTEKESFPACQAGKCMFVDVTKEVRVYFPEEWLVKNPKK